MQNYCVVETRIAEIFNTYGPRLLLNDERIIFNLLVQSIYRKDLIIYSNGNKN